jgi:hypothetical protein
VQPARQFRPELPSDGAAQQPLGLGALDRPPELVRIGAAHGAITDRAGYSRDQQRVHRDHITFAERAPVHTVQLSPAGARVIARRDRQMHARRVNIRQSVQHQGRFMRDHPAAQRPHYGCREVIMWTTRQHRYSVHSPSHMF